jgi:hypothetical protein
MRTTVRLASGAAVLSFASVAAAPAAVAQTVDCAVYPDRCVQSDVVVDRPPVVVADTDTDTGNGTVSERSSTSPSATSLPFTGGEVVLLSVLGAGALAAGTALVVAGRRRSSTTA